MTSTDVRVESDVYIDADGNALSRTSRVLDLLGSDNSGLMDWAGRLALERGNAKAHRDELDFLSRAGIRAHEIIECAVMARLIEQGRADPELAGMPEMDLASAVDAIALTASDNWARWLERRGMPNGFEPYAAELQILSKKLGFAGTVDCVAHFEGRDGDTPGTWVMDWKTSSRADKLRYRMQVVAYAALVEEECVWVEGAPPGFQDDKLAPTGRRIVTREHAQALGMRGEPVEIVGAAIVRADRKQRKFDHVEVKIGEFPTLWAVFAKLLELDKLKPALDRAQRQK